MKMLKVTCSHDSRSIRINPLNISSIFVYQSVTGARIFMNDSSGDRYWDVRETPEEIDKLLEELK